MNDNFNLGIKNYSPSFFESADELINTKGEFLYELRGKRIESVFIVWSTEHNEIWMGSPVVMNIGNLQVELCANKTEEFSITSNTFDMDSPLNWYGSTDFEWKELINYSDEYFIVKDIRVIELENVISNVSNNPGFKNKWWSLGGIQFIGESKMLSIYNGFDCNLITVEPINGQGIRYLSLKTANNT